MSITKQKMTKQEGSCLDWTRLLGFDQVDRKDVVKSLSFSKLGAKVSAKPGFKPMTLSKLGAKVGEKRGDKPTLSLSKLGAKVGVKVGLKPISNG